MVAEKAGVHRRTLHLYFGNRQELIEFCKAEMMTTCQHAMTVAYHASTDPVKQLELMLYAGIDCGAKYAFLDKIYGHTAYGDIAQDEKNGAYDSIKSEWFKVIASLQQNGSISQQLSIAWIFALFGSMITNTINVSNSGDVVLNDIKGFAWYSFSKSIGL